MRARDVIWDCSDDHSSRRRSIIELHLPYLSQETVNFNKNSTNIALIFRSPAVAMTEGSVRVAPRRFSEESTNGMSMPETKRLRKSLEGFNSFCSYILAYEARQQEELRRRQNPKSSGEESTTSSTDSAYSESLSSPDSSDERLLDDVDEEYESGDESWNKVTCFCQKPFAGRPMIECSECLIWIHLSCAKIRKSNVPEVFVCQKCRDARHTMRRSKRVKTTPSPKHT